MRPGMVTVKLSTGTKALIREVAPKVIIVCAIPHMMRGSTIKGESLDEYLSRCARAWEAGGLEYEIKEIYDSKGWTEI